MILLKNILREAKLYSYTTKELLEKFLSFDGKTLVFIDTETTGIDPNKFFVQLTQLAMLAVDGSTWEVKEEFSAKVELTSTLSNIINDPTSKEAQAFEKENQRHLKKYKRPQTHPEELLKKTQYYNKNDGEQTLPEKDVLIAYEKFLEKYPNCVVVAHNAGFDMKVIQSRRRINGLPPTKRVSVLDTVKIARFFFVPALVSLEGNPEIKAFLDKILARTKWRSYSTELGKLANAFEINIENWHDATADTKMLMEVIRKIIEFLKENQDVDIRRPKGKQAKRFRKM
jgi:DNA polymerase III epsilon subunit-like protein